MRAPEPSSVPARAEHPGTGHRAALLEGMSPRVNPPVDLTVELPEYDVTPRWPDFGPVPPALSEFRAGDTTLPPERDDCGLGSPARGRAEATLSPGKRAWIIITLASLCWALVFSLAAATTALLPADRRDAHASESAR